MMWDAWIKSGFGNVDVKKELLAFFRRCLVCLLSGMKLSMVESNLVDLAFFIPKQEKK